MPYENEYPYLYDEASDETIAFYNELAKYHDHDRWFVLANLAESLNGISANNPSLRSLADMFLDGPNEVEYESEVIYLITRSWSDDDPETKNRKMREFVGLLERLPPVFAKWSEGWMLHKVVAAICLFPKESLELGINGIGKSWSYDTSNLFDDIYEDFDDAEFELFTGYSKSDIDALVSATTDGGFIPHLVPKELLELLPEYFEKEIGEWAAFPDILPQIVVRMLMHAQEPFETECEPVDGEFPVVLASTLDGSPIEVTFTREQYARLLVVVRERNTGGS